MRHASEHLPVYTMAKMYFIFLDYGGMGKIVDLKIGNLLLTFSSNTQFLRVSRALARVFF